MAGSLYDVSGNLVFASGEVRCPQTLKGQQVQLKSSDGAVFNMTTEAACISSDLRSIMEEKGTEEGIELPFKKSLVSKLAEYMTYHKDTPFAEVQVPLAGDTLAECGVLKFDVNFMKVDRDLLFDLMLAAQHMDIPSLLFLAGCQAALLVKDKDAGTVRKTFGMANDMSQDELDTLTAVLEKRQKRNKGDNAEASRIEEPGLISMAAFVSGMTQAAEKHGLSPFGKLSEPLKSKVSSRSMRFAGWRAIVAQDWRQLLIAPDEVKDDKDTLQSAIAASGGLALQYAGDDLLLDNELILEAARLNGEVLKYAAPELCEDEDFVMQAIMLNGSALVGANEDLRGSKDFVMKCCQKGRGSAMKGATDELKSDREFILSCIEVDPEAFKHASPALRESREFTMEAVCRHGGALQHARTIFKADREIVERAVANDASALIFAHSSRRAELQHTVVPKEPVKLPSEEEEEELQQEVATGPRTMGIPLMRRDEGGQMGEPGEIMRPVHMCYMSGMGTILINMGQANYFAANLINEKMPAYDREMNVDSTVLLWGGVGGGVGMRWKAFASADMFNDNPDALLTVQEARSILVVMATKLDAPEFVGGSSFDQYTRGAILSLSAGFGSGGGWKPGEDYLGQPSVPENLRTSLKVGPEGPELEDPMALEEDERQHEAPLGGWVHLARVAAVEAPAAEPELPSLEEGARVQLVGLSQRSGQTGVVVAAAKDGRWKVKLDSDQGVALLKGEYLQPVATPSEAVQGVGLELQAKLEEKRIAAEEAQKARRKNIEARRAELKLQMDAKRAAREVL